MKIFISGSFASRERLKPYRTILQERGHQVLSSWLDSPVETWPDPDRSCREARRDWREIREANTLIFDTLEQTTMGNSLVEFGIGLALRFRQFVVGPPLNHYYLLLPRFKNWDELLASEPFAHHAP